MLSRLRHFLPPTPPPPDIEKPELYTCRLLLSDMYKRRNGMWHFRHAELSREGILILFYPDRDGNKKYDINKPKKLIVGAGKNSVLVKIITSDGHELYLKIKEHRDLWARKLIEFKFTPNEKEEEKESLEEDSFLGDSFFEKNVSAMETERRSQKTAEEPRLDIEKPKSPDGKTMEIGEGLPNEEKKKNGSIESMDATQVETDEMEGLKTNEEKKKEASVETKEDEVDKDMGVWHDGHVARMAKKFDRLVSKAKGLASSGKTLKM